MKIVVMFDKVAGDSCCVYRDDVINNKQKFWQEVISSFPLATYKQVEEHGKSKYVVDTEKRIEGKFKITKHGIENDAYIITEPSILFSSMLKEYNKNGVIYLDIKERG